MEISKDHETAICPLDGTIAPRWMEVDGYPIHRCPSCGLGFVFPAPDIPSQIYGEDYFFGSTQGYGYVDYDADKQAMSGELRKISQEVADRVGHKGKLLDVGAATGFFVELAAKDGWDAEGIEISAAAVRAGKEKGRKLTCGTLESLPADGSFDAMTLLDVLEHVPDPLSTLRSVHQRLSPDGVVLVNVPDAGSLFARIMSRRWHAIIPPEHLSYFTRKSLRRALEVAGFDEIRFRKPLKSFRLQYIVSIFARKHPSKLLHRMQRWLERSWVGRIVLPVPIFDNLQATAKKASGTAGSSRASGSGWKLFTLLAIVAVLFLTPILRVRLIAGDTWRGVVPPVVDDDVYYYARLHEILDGHPLIGNPYFYEHRNDPSPAFIGADWLASVPFFFMPFQYGVAWNLLFWPMLSALLAHVLFQRSGAKGWWAVAGAVVFILASYEVFIRPTSMQVVLPSLLIFWLALQAWFRSPMSRRTVGWLAVATALQFYIYSYLWLAAGGTYLACIAILALQRRRSEAVRCIAAGIASLLIALPSLWLMYIQSRNPWYWETMSRIGLVLSHVPPLLAFELTAWIVAICLLWKMIRPPQITDVPIGDFFLPAGAGIAVAMLSPILSGNELATANHLLRFAIPWGTSVLIVLAATVSAARWREMSAMRRCGALLLCIAALYYPFSAALAVPRFFWMTSVGTQADVRDVQSYAGPASWLAAHAKESDVVMADAHLSTYIPILTRQYVLFEPFGTLHLMSTREAEDRFLVAQAFQPPTVASLVSQYRTYAGTGNAIDLPNTRIREARSCRMLRVVQDCGTPVTSILEWKGQGYFDELVRRFQTEVFPDIVGAFRRFHVTYIVKDMTADADWDVAGLPGMKKVYTDGRFEIYQIGQ